MAIIILLESNKVHLIMSYSWPYENIYDLVIFILTSKAVSVTEKSLTG